MKRTFLTAMVLRDVGFATMRLLLRLCILIGLGAAPAAAGTYVQQGTFNVPTGYIKGMDTDGIGNLYVLSLPGGKSTYWVSSYQTPGITPLFSFDTGLSSPTAFAVEAGGVVDVLDGSGGAGAIVLKRFQNNGTFIGQTQYSLSTPWLSSAIDKNGRVLLSTEFWMTWYCTWVCSKPNGNYGSVDVYDFTGKLLSSFTLPGNSTSGGCYAPSRMTVDPQGNLYVADLVCNNLLKYSSSGALLTQTPFQGWAYNQGFQGMWTDPASDVYISQPSGIAKFDSNGNALASLTPNPPVGDGWDSRILYLPSSGGSPVQRWIYDGAPSVPTETSPLSAVSQHSASATLNWQASADPDGDPVTYSVYLGASPSQLSFIGSTAQTSMATPALSFGVQYYWQVVAQDSYLGLPLLTQSAPVVSFSLNFVNNPPGPFTMAAGTGTAVTRGTSLTMKWNTSTDPDGDPVVYDVYWRTGAQASAALIGTTTSTYWNMTGLAFGSTYYWSVTARDPYRATTSMTGGEQAYGLIFQNSPPSLVAYLSTSAAYSLHTTSPSIALSWAPSTDPDGDPVSYQLEVQTSTGDWPSTALGAATSFSLGAQLETTYYWRVEVADPYGGVSTGPWAGFIVHLANRPPNPLAYASPSTLVTRATSYALSWQDTGDPDGDAVVYGFFLSTDPANQFLIQQGTQTAYPLNFQFGTTYYWRVSATDNFGARTDGPVQSFLPTFRNSPPPPPAILSGVGTIGEHALTPSGILSWSSVLDPDGDPVGYRLFVGSSPAGLAPVQDSSATSYGLGGAQFGTTYYWAVSAYDPYGGASTSPVQSLFLFLQNSPPLPFAVLAGTGTLATRTTSQLLIWQPAVDPDGDLVTYALSLSTTPSALALVQTSTATSYTLTFQIGTTYYWQVTASDGFGGATFSDVQIFLPVFRNSPPTIPVNQSRTGTVQYHGFSPSQSFFWQSSTDPDGDPFTYSLYYGTDAIHMSVVSPVPLGYTLSNLPLNAAVYYRIVATDIFGAASASPLDWVFYQFTDNPPGPFDVLGTTGTVATRDTSATLSWTPSTDPDGDPVNYGVLVGTAPTSLAILTTTSKTSAVLVGMTYGTTYYWRVDAYDGFGATTTTNEGVQSLVYLYYDPAPSAPVYLSSASVYSQHTSSPAVALSWAPSTNATGDPISYRLDVQAGSAPMASWAMGASTTLTLGVLFETTYYWRVTASDPYGNASTAPWAGFIVHLANQPPGAFSLALGTGTLTTRTTSQILSWTGSSDPDGDAVTYGLYLSTTPGLMPLVQLSSAISYSLGFQFGTTYYWSVSAFDGFGGTTTMAGGTQTFYPIFLSAPPQAVTIVSPFNRSPVVSTMRNYVTVSWDQVSDSEEDPITYTVYFGDSAQSLAPLATLGDGEKGPTTTLAMRSLQIKPQAEVSSSSGTFTLSLTGLDYYKTYYLQVAASNPYGAATLTPVETFSLASPGGFPKAYNYPNPFSPGRSGTNIVFNAPPSGYARATVEVYSEWQDLLFKQDYFNIPPGVSQVHLDGRDRYGKAFFNGSYICRVRLSSPDDEQIFHMLVVK